MKQEDVRVKYNALFDKCFLISLDSDVESDTKRDIEVSLGGCKHWMEVYLHQTTSTSLKDEALEIFNEYYTETLDLLEKAYN